MSETTAEQARQTVARTGDVDAPGVKFDSLGREFVDYGDEFRITCGLGADGSDGVIVEDKHGDAVFVPHSTLCRTMPALTTYAAHRSFIAPEAKPGVKAAEPEPIQSAESGGLT